MRRAASTFTRSRPGFRAVKGLISKHFIWSESGWAGGVYQWERLEDAQALYGGAWLAKYAAKDRVLRRPGAGGRCGLIYRNGDTQDDDQEEVHQHTLWRLSAAG